MVKLPESLKKTPKGKPATLEQSALKTSILQRPAMGKGVKTGKQKGFDVSPLLAIEFKTYAQTNDMSEKKLLENAFAVYKKAGLPSDQFKENDDNLTGTLLRFNMQPEWAKEFALYAIAHGMTQKQLLLQAYRYYRKINGF